MTVFLNHTNILIDLYEHNTHQFDIKRVAFDLLRKELAYHVGGDNHNSFALESSERFHLSTARSWVNVGLVQNVVPGRFQFGQSGNGGQSWTFGFVAEILYLLLFAARSRIWLKHSVHCLINSSHLPE